MDKELLTALVTTWIGVAEANATRRAYHIGLSGMAITQDAVDRAINADMACAKAEQAYGEALAAFVRSVVHATFVTSLQSKRDPAVQE